MSQFTRCFLGSAFKFFRSLGFMKSQMGAKAQIWSQKSPNFDCKAQNSQFSQVFPVFFSSQISQVFSVLFGKLCGIFYENNDLKVPERYKNGP